ncbi:MAG: DUF5131 family protein [Acidobacteria bacterium]|nr:DUF5131 family protein [Acidobacteriota bacterium]
MSLSTNIGWCDSTINPSTGCDGCELWNMKQRSCYAGNLHENRLAVALPSLYDPVFTQVRVAPGRMTQAANWHDLRGKERPTKPWLSGLPRFIFVGDMGDFLSQKVSDEYFSQEILRAVQSEAGQRHIWLLLTKRPRRLAKLATVIGGLPANVIAMTTITSQHTADLRIPALLSIPCYYRAISAEPLLETINITSFAPVDWLITGGESGPGARPTPFTAFHHLQAQCNRLNIPFFFKQAGGEDKQKGGKKLDGRTYTAMPRLQLSER